MSKESNSKLLSIKNILITNLYPGHLEVIESIIIKFLPIVCKHNLNHCHIDIELFDYSNINDKSKKPAEFINYIKNKYNNVNFSKKNIIYDYIIDNTTIGSKSPAKILQANFIVNKKNFLKGNYPKNKNIIISDSKKHYYISHRIEEEFFKNIPNVYYLTPLCKSKNYFIPSILPEINKKTSEKLICAIQGNLWIKSRNFESLIPLLETYDNFYIKLIGRGSIPECLTNYTKRIIMCNNLEWSDYHKAFEDVYCILPLIDDTFRHNYFTTSLTSSISYAEGYNLKCFYYKKLDDIYKIDNSIVYDSDNMVEQFQKVIDSFNNKKSYCNRYSFEKKNILNFNEINYNSKEFYGYYGNGTSEHDGLYFLSNLKNENKNIVFIFHGAVGKEIIDPHSNIKYLKRDRIVFRGYNFEIDNTDIICISDYLINKYDDYVVGYFQSTKKFNCDFLYSELIKSIISDKKYERIIFTGTSAGGFASIQYASKFGGIALVSNSPLYLIDGKMNKYEGPILGYYKFSQLLLKHNDKTLYQDNDIENIILKGKAKKIIMYVNDEDDITNMDVDKLELFISKNKLNDKINIIHFKKKGNPNSHAHNFMWSEDNTKNKHLLFLKKTLLLD